MRFAARRGIVLAYHGVGEVTDAEDANRLVVTPARLRSQIRLLQRVGYRFITATELAERRRGAPPQPGTALLTFDDGWRDARTTVVPLLEELGAVATFFVVGGWWGGQHPNVPGPAGRILTRDDASVLVNAGMDLGSHTMTHPDLRLLADAELRRQLEQSKAEVEAITGGPCRTLAYPYGLFDSRVETAALDAGYELSFAWMPGPWRGSAAPRLPGPPRHGAGRLALKLLGVRSRTP